MSLTRQITPISLSSQSASFSINYFPTVVFPALKSIHPSSHASLATPSSTTPQSPPFTHPAIIRARVGCTANVYVPTPFGRRVTHTHHVMIASSSSTTPISKGFLGFVSHVCDYYFPLNMTILSTPVLSSSGSPPLAQTRTLSPTTGCWRRRLRVVGHRGQ
jgi:hypothetical protein